jgi:hypothetical protein
MPFLCDRCHDHEVVLARFNAQLQEDSSEEGENDDGDEQNEEEDQEEEAEGGDVAGEQEEPDEDDESQEEDVGEDEEGQENPEEEDRGRFSGDEGEQHSNDDGGHLVYQTLNRAGWIETSSRKPLSHYRRGYAHIVENAVGLNESLSVLIPECADSCSNSSHHTTTLKLCTKNTLTPSVWKMLSTRLNPLLSLKGRTIRPRMQLPSAVGWVGMRSLWTSMNIVSGTYLQDLAFQMVVPLSGIWTIDLITTVMI